MLLIVFIIIFGIFISIQIFSLWSIQNIHSCEITKQSELPKVSILLAARNEEKLILRNLKALEAQNYPKDKIEILIGDDQSTDKTSELIQNFIKDKPEFKLFYIDKNLGKGRAKANVLAHLAHNASGEYYFITDVDVKLPTDWILGMLEQFNSDVGIVSGTTKCERGNTFATLQGVDWLHFMGYIKAFATRGIGCTSVGNNMAVRAEAYWQTGGYENIDFSITEDYKLFQEVTHRGWKWSNALNPQTLGLAYHIPKISELLHQRKRWLIGARELPLNWRAMLIIYGSFYPVLILAFITHPKLAWIVFALKLNLQTIFIYTLFKKSERPYPRSITYLLYELYVWTMTLLTAIFFLLPVKMKWKGRKF